MGSIYKGDREDTYSVISDECDVGFLDFENDRSLHEYEMYCGDPVIISNPFPVSGGRPRSGIVGETCADLITMKNTTNDPVELWGVRIFSSNPTDSFQLSLMKPPSHDMDPETARNFVGSTSLEDRVLQPGQTLTIWLSCKPQDIGMHTSVIHFDVGDDKIERVAFLLADDKVSQSLASNNPYRRAPKKKGFEVTQYVAGSRPPRKNVREYRYRLPLFEIPGDLRELIENEKVPDVIIEGLNRRNYAKFFSTLLVMEEIHLQVEMKGHNMERVPMMRRGSHFLSLVVPGLAERRPSLVCGDFIFAKPVLDGPGDRNPPFQGYIHRVESDEIYLKFSIQLHQRHRDGDLYNVSFEYNRVNMRRLYQAVQEAETLGPDFLFPAKECGGRVINDKPITPLNKNINREQLLAVQKILNCRGFPPYIIHGPPGTGKTMTIVEAILQLYKTKRDSRILVCAASNSAADHVLEKIISDDKVRVEANKVFRLNASSRVYEDVRREFIGFCYFEDMVFKCPPLNALSRYKIIVSTYMSTSQLYAEGIPRGHFSHIILDEAGQASEPEAMVPVANLSCRGTVIVLAGDPMQLGPVVFSKDAESYGLGKSYLERLFECEFNRSGDENYVTKLVRNYRCHPAILDLPSRLFYKGELVPSKEDDDSHFYNLVGLPNKTFPVLFVGIQGCDEREGSNPSWFNRTEASKVVEFIRKLRRSMDLDESDVGVITPYRQQVTKVKRALESADMLDVKVGSVEQFQGQERKIIIISTVRSTIKHNEFDRVHHLGFLSNPRRFNVAITRAKSLLVIVGNPHIISKDLHWNQLLRHCVDNGSYQGCPLPPLEVLEPVVSNFTEESQCAYQDDTQWAGEQTTTEWDDYIPEPRWDECIPTSNGDQWGGEDSSRCNDGEWGKCDRQQFCTDTEWREDSNRICQKSETYERSESCHDRWSDGDYASNNGVGSSSSATGWD